MPYSYFARLVSVTDGDTARFDLDLGFHSWRLGQAYRLLRINAPELRELGGIAARDALAAFLAGKTLMVQTQKADSFGRWLAEVTADGKNVSDLMVEQGYAKYAVYSSPKEVFNVT